MAAGTEGSNLASSSAESGARKLGFDLYRELLALVKDKSVVLEEYATRLVASEAVHIREMEVMLMKSAPD